MTPNGPVGPRNRHMPSSVAFETWPEGGRKSPAQWRVSQSVGLVRPSWWILVPLGQSSSCPSLLSSFASPCHAQRANFQLRGTTGILLISSTNGIAFFLVVPFLVIIHWRTIVVTSVLVLSVIFFVRVLVILLLQLSFQLMVLLSEPFNRYGKALHLPLRW